MKNSFRNRLWLALPLIMIFIIGIAVFCVRSEFLGTVEHNAAKVADHLGYEIQTVHGYREADVSPNDPQIRIITIRGFVDSEDDLQKIRTIVDESEESMLTSTIAFEVVVRPSGTRAEQ